MFLYHNGDENFSVDFYYKNVKSVLLEIDTITEFHRLPYLLKSEQPTIFQKVGQFRPQERNSGKWRR